MEISTVSGVILLFHKKLMTCVLLIIIGYSYHTNNLGSHKPSLKRLK